MVYLVKKESKGSKYYQIVESIRVNGKPTHKVLRHLGSPHNLLNLLLGFENPIAESASSVDYGNVLALYNISKSIGFMDIMNRNTTKSRNGGLTPGEMILIMTINRCLDPCSKRKIKDWIQTTYLPTLMKIDTNYITTQNLYRHMDYLTDSVVKSIEYDIWNVLVKKYNIDPSKLLYDTTSIYFFMNEHKGNKLPKRGYPRGNFKPGLRQVNIALLVTSKHGFPLTRILFEGNINDVTQFDKSINVLAERYKNFAQECKDITVMFDKGNNSKNNIKKLKGSGYHFIGSLRLDHHRKLLNSISMEQFKGEYKNKKEKTTKFCAMEKVVLGSKRKLVITYSPDIYKQKSKRFNEQLDKAWKEVTKLKGKVGKNKWKNRDNVLVKVNEILKDHKKKKYVGYKITGKTKFMLKLWKKQNIIEEQEMVWGKNILFTDQMDWKEKDIIEAYRSKNVVEEGIKILKGPIKINPVRHFKDRRIKEHVVICIFGLLFLAILKYNLDKFGIDMSIERCLDELENVKYYTFKLQGLKKSFTHINWDKKHAKLKMLVTT